MSLCREFPWFTWVPGESHGNGKYYYNSEEMRKSTGMPWKNGNSVRITKMLTGGALASGAKEKKFRPGKVKCQLFGCDSKDHV